MTEAPHERNWLTRLLKEWGGGNKEALDELMPVVYQQFANCGICLRAERPDHTLRATALVHEAYLRLSMPMSLARSRSLFRRFGAPDPQILVDHAKETSGRRAVDGNHLFGRSGHDWPANHWRIIELDAALQRWRRLTRAKAKSSSYFCFGGLTYDEAAAGSKVSRNCAPRLKMAKAWLHPS